MSSNVDAHNSPLIKTIISEDADYIFDGITGTLPIIGGVPTLNWKRGNELFSKNFLKVQINC